jgi:hypothetical protein
MITKLKRFKKQWRVEGWHWCFVNLSIHQFHYYQHSLTLDNARNGDDHYNNMGLFCDPNIIANNKKRCFRNPAVANHNSSQTLKLLWYHNIHTRTIASPSQLPNLIQSQNFFDYNCFYPVFAINITSETICSKPITATT